MVNVARRLRSDRAGGQGGILATAPVARDAGDIIGDSREGRPVRAFRFGRGSRRVSLLGGCHADEPVGPLMLRRLAAFLSGLAEDDPWLTEWDWWLIPHINPDGEQRNRAWYDDEDTEYDFVRYMSHVIRERPGDDIEFGFPVSPTDEQARPENRAAFEFWQAAAGPFTLHVSFHGMAFGAGPWFLVEAAWRQRISGLKKECADSVAEMGYELHDVDRQGEKGFVRLDRGFTTRPDSRAMRTHFESLGDNATAALFRPSSMETIRALGGDPLTLVSEMPLFLTPGVGATLGPPDPVAEEWKTRIAPWRMRVVDEPAAVAREATAAGLTAMPVLDQMALQVALLQAGLRTVAR